MSSIGRNFFLAAFAFAGAAVAQPAGSTPPPPLDPPAATENQQTEVPAAAVGQPQEGAREADATAQPAVPGQAKTQQADEGFGEEIVITGSRIPRLELTTAAPVTVLNREQIEASGRTSIGEILQSIPEQTGGINTQVNNGGDGSVRINLRGLGTARTLVLLNGRRHVAGGTGANASVDLNTIPTAAIERIEVLKDGASAVYGSDAISGVVNVITRKDFAGTEARAFGGISSRGDGTIYDLSLTTGEATDRANILFNAGFYTQKEAWAGNRDYSRFDYFYDWASRQIFTLGSSSIPQGNFGGALDPRTGGPATAKSGTAAYQALRARIGGRRFTIDRETGEYRAYIGTGIEEAGGDQYNYQPENYLVTPAQRAHIYSNGGVKLGNAARAFFEASYTNRQSQQKLAPEPLFTTSERVIVSAQNPYNPFGVHFRDVRRRFVEFSNRVFSQDLDTFRVVAGLEGRIANTLNWDVAYNYGRTQGVATKTGLLQRSRLAAAIGPGFIDPSGVPRCGTPAAPIAECVPLNLFGRGGYHNTITPEMVQGLTYRGTLRGLNQQNSFTANVGAELFRLTENARPVGVAAGYEFRREVGANIPDPLTARGDTTGNKGEPTEGAYFVNEGYAELSIPLLGRGPDDTGAPQPDIVEISLAARGFNYNTFGGGLTYKAGARVSPVPDATLRATYSTAFRAPSIGELFSGQADSFPRAQDPCDARTRTPGSVIDQVCTAQGIPAGFTDDRVQLLTRVGGNPALRPETAQTFTVGLVVEPRAMRDLSFTVDYFNINVRNAVSAVGVDVILASCYSANSQYCDRIERHPDTKAIERILNPLSNVGGDRTSGIDFAVDFTPQTPVGRLALSADVTWLQRIDTELAGGKVVVGKGVYDLGPFPEWRGNFGAALGMNPLRLGANLRWIGGFRECEENVCEVVEGEVPLTRAISPYAAVDASIAYTNEASFGNTTVQLGVNNVLDTRPAIIRNGFTAQSEPTIYDFMGRYFYVRLSHSFF